MPALKISTLALNSTFWVTISRLKILILKRGSYSSISALFISDRQLPFSQRCALNGRLPRRVSPVQSGGEPHIAHEWPPHRWRWSPGGWRLRRPASRCDRGTWSHSIYFRTVKLFFSGTFISFLAGM